MRGHVKATTSAQPANRSVLVLLGAESSGKSALFRGFTGQAAGDESNFRGSTVVCRNHVASLFPGVQIVDTPGLQAGNDSVTTRLALAALDEGDVVGLVIRATSPADDLKLLVATLGSRLQQLRTFVICTFADHATDGLNEWLHGAKVVLGVPVSLVDARRIGPTNAASLQEAMASANRPQPLNESEIRAFDHAPKRHFQERLRRKLAFPPITFALIALTFLLPVYAAYCLAEVLSPVLDESILTPLKTALAPWSQRHDWLGAVFIGDYGILTLGAYSFLWAFPVVLFLGVAMALTDEIGIRDHLCRSLDPFMRRFGLSGRDLGPVLGGFGCNVVAVLQSRSCARENRSACVTLVAFGSSCSYQLGANLSVFSAAGKPYLFLPMVASVFFSGLLHTYWRRGRARPAAHRIVLASPPTLLQWPTFRGMWWRVKTVCRQFLFSAMPVFVVLCLISALMAHAGILDRLSALSAPVLQTLFGLPADVAPALLFSVVRKDGLLLLNHSQGSAAAALTTGSLFLTVFMASTLTPCLVTMATVGKELGFATALRITWQQLATALLASLSISLLLRALVYLV